MYRGLYCNARVCQIELWRLDVTHFVHIGQKLSRTYGSQRQEAKLKAPHYPLARSEIGNYLSSGSVLISQARQMVSILHNVAAN